MIENIKYLGFEFIKLSLNGIKQFRYIHNYLILDKSMRMKVVITKSQSTNYEIDKSILEELIKTNRIYELDFDRAFLERNNLDLGKISRSTV